MKSETIPFIETVAARRCREMADTVMNAGKNRRIGQIIGDPGLGKSEIAEALARDLNGAFITAWETMSVNGLLIAVARALGDKSLRDNTANDRVFSALRELCQDRLIIVDEVNLMNWKHMEALRYLSDQCGASLILVGTLLFSDYLSANKTRTLTAQLSSRIGGKSVTIEAMSKREVGAAVLKPRYAGADAEAFDLFHKFTGGRWREVVEMAETCDRIMAAHHRGFDVTVVESAAVAMGKAAIKAKAVKHA